MRALVTGGAGFIGHNVVRLLEAQGVMCFITDTKTSYGCIPQGELDYLYKERMARTRADAINIDVRESEHMKSYASIFSVDTIIHCASFPRQKVVSANPTLAADVMCKGLISVLEAARHAKVKRFVYVSSSMVYGDFANDVSEVAECNPQGQYGIMKYMGEKLVEDYARRYGFEYVIVRPSAVYGELDVEDRVVSKFILGAMRGETLNVRGANEILDFTYVEDAANGIVLAATAPEAANNIYNITRSSKHMYTLLDAAKLAVSIAKNGSIAVMDRDLEFPQRGRLNIARAQTDLGYDPKVNVEEGFVRYFQWVKDSAFWQRRI